MILTVIAAAANSGTGEEPSSKDAGPGDGSAQPKRVRPRVVQYKQTPQGKLRMYVYLPEGWKVDDRRPAMLGFHGGAWKNGSARNFYAKTKYFRKRGMVVFCVEYRLNGKHKTTIEACVEDAKSAMRWVRSHAGEWGVDPDRIVAAGSSAGAHLAAACALVKGFDSPDDDPKVSCKPQALVLFSAVLRKEDMLGRLERPDWPSRLMGKTKEEKTRRLAELMPMTHLRKSCPPVIMFSGSKDPFISGGRAFAKRALELGNRAELWSAKGGGHNFINEGPWLNTAWEKSDIFLKSLGFLKGDPPEIVGPKKAMTREIPAPATAEVE